MDDLYKKSLELHKKFKGKLSTISLVSVKNKADLSLVYTPGVAAVSRAIAEGKASSFDFTWRGRCIAVISDGSAVLGLGDIGPEAAIPVMEGKAILLKEFGGVDAVPIVVNTKDPGEIIQFVKHIAPSFAGINLEDISAPRCLQIEEGLQDIGIPVFHDDQHGTAIVASAALRNAVKVVGKDYSDLKVVVVGAGSAGLAITKMLLGLSCEGDRCEIVPGARRVKDVIVVDSIGALIPGRHDQNIYKGAVAGLSNLSKRSGNLIDIIEGADAIIGVSGPNTITPAMVKKMAEKPIVFAMANPVPEIMPADAKKAGAYIVATGRSDMPNQINNVLAFPGIFRAVIDGKLKKITPGMKQAASYALSNMIKKPTVNNIIPDVFTPHLAEKVAKEVLKSARN